MNARRSTLMMAGSAVLAVAVAAGIWAWRRNAADRPASDTAHTPTADTAMQDMPGMSMNSGGSVRLTSDQIRQFGITFGTVEQHTLEGTVRTVGTVTVDESRLSQVVPRFAGFVERLFVDKTGQRVGRGQALMEVYSPELLAAQQELLVAADLEKSIGQSAVPGVPAVPANLVAAARRRLEFAGISQAQIDEVMRTGQPRRALTLYAPESGVVLEKNVVRGQAINPGQMLYTIADLRVVWIEVALREGDAATVREGSGADAVFEALPGQPYKGRVTYIYPMLDSVARTVRARVEVANTAGRLKPGMYATVTLTTPSRTVLAVPTNALVRTGERTLVFVEMGAGELMPHTVQVGRTAGEFTEVLSGVERGHRVVTSAQFLLDSESNLAEVMRSLMGQMGAQDMGSMKGMER